MKSKTYWNKATAEQSPFEGPRSIRSEVAGAARRASTRFGGREGVEYLWIHLASKNCSCETDQQPLELEAWLNIVDEAAALGTTWVVIYVGADLDSYKDLWELSRWAQSAHEMRVALHFTGGELSESDIVHLNGLDRARTYLFAEHTHLETFRALSSLHVGVVSAAIPEHARESNCTSPGNIACVQANGTMYCCGLVVGDDRYALGDAQAQPLVDVVLDEALPHAVPGTENYPLHGCDGCPSHLSHVVFEQLDRHLKA